MEKRCTHLELQLKESIHTSSLLAYTTQAQKLVQAVEHEHTKRAQHTPDEGLDIQHIVATPVPPAARSPGTAARTAQGASQYSAVAVLHESIGRFTSVPPKVEEACDDSGANSVMHKREHDNSVMYKREHDSTPSHKALSTHTPIENKVMIQIPHPRKRVLELTGHSCDDGKDGVAITPSTVAGKEMWGVTPSGVPPWILQSTFKRQILVCLQKRCAAELQRLDHKYANSNASPGPDSVNSAVTSPHTWLHASNDKVKTSQCLHDAYLKALRHARERHGLKAYCWWRSRSECDKRALRATLAAACFGTVGFMAAVYQNEVIVAGGFPDDSLVIWAKILNSACTLLCICAVFRLYSMNVLVMRISRHCRRLVPLNTSGESFKTSQLATQFSIRKIPTELTFENLFQPLVPMS